MTQLLACLQVRPVAEDEMFKVLRSGKRKQKQWKRMVTKVTFVGQNFTRKPPKYERFIRPTGVPACLPVSHVSHYCLLLWAAAWPEESRLLCFQPVARLLQDLVCCQSHAQTTPALCAGLRMKKAHVTHPELKTTFCLEIIGVKKNPNGASYTQLGVVTRGTVIEVNVSELGLVTPGGKVVWGKYAQVTNNPENDGCINAVLLV